MNSDEVTSRNPIEGETTRQIVRGIRFVISLVALAAGVFFARAIWTAPKFNRIFQEMLGPDSELPRSTRLLIDYQPVFLIAAFLLAVIPVVVAIRSQNVFLIIALGAITTIIQISLGVWASTALMTPFYQLIQGI